MSLDCMQVNTEAAKKQAGGVTCCLVLVLVTQYTFRFLCIYVVRHTIFHGPYHAVNSRKSVLNSI